MQLYLKKNISIVIPNYNGSYLLRQNLPFLQSSLESDGINNYEIIVADDASTDDSVSFLRANYPDIILIQGEKNLGFSGNINRGINQASKDLVFLLNSDVKLTNHYFHSCLKFFENPDTFGVSGKVLSPTGDVQDTAKYPEIIRLKIKGTINYEIKDSSMGYWTPNFFLSGGNALIDRNKLISLGGFDEIYNPYYGEDVDLSIRAWRSGYKCYYNPEAVCYHPASSTISKEKKSKVQIIMRRNRLVLHHIHLNRPYLSAWLLVNWIKFFCRKLIGDKNFSKSFTEYLKRYPEIKKRRQEAKSFVKSLNKVKKEILFLLKNKNVIRIN